MKEMQELIEAARDVLKNHYQSSYDRLAKAVREARKATKVAADRASEGGARAPMKEMQEKIRNDDGDINDDDTI